MYVNYIQKLKKKKKTGKMILWQQLPHLRLTNLIKNQPNDNKLTDTDDAAERPLTKIQLNHGEPWYWCRPFIVDTYGIPSLCPLTLLNQEPYIRQAKLCCSEQSWHLRLLSSRQWINSRFCWWAKSLSISLISFSISLIRASRCFASLSVTCIVKTVLATRLATEKSGNK